MRSDQVIHNRKAAPANWTKDNVVAQMLGLDTDKELTRKYDRIEGSRSNFNNFKIPEDSEKHTSKCDRRLSAVAGVASTGLQPKRET